MWSRRIFSPRPLRSASSLQQKPGAIVITSSTNGFQAEFDSTAYDTSKGALVMMTRSLALSLAEHHIRVNGLAPGFIETPLTAGALKNNPACKEALEKRSPLAASVSRRIAAARRRFSAPAALDVTGQILVIDGRRSPPASCPAQDRPLCMYFP